MLTPSDKINIKVAEYCLCNFAYLLGNPIASLLSLLSNRIGFMYEAKVHQVTCKVTNVTMAIEIQRVQLPFLTTKVIHRLIPLVTLYSSYEIGRNQWYQCAKLCFC